MIGTLLLYTSTYYYTPPQIVIIIMSVNIYYYYNTTKILFVFAGRPKEYRNACLNLKKILSMSCPKVRWQSVLNGATNENGFLHRLCA